MWSEEEKRREEDSTKGIEEIWIESKNNLDSDEENKFLKSWGSRWEEQSVWLIVTIVSLRITIISVYKRQNHRAVKFTQKQTHTHIHTHKHSNCRK